MTVRKQTQPRRTPQSERANFEKATDHERSLAITRAFEKDNPKAYKFPDPKFFWKEDRDMMRYMPHPLEQQDDDKKKKYRGFMLVIQNYTDEDIVKVAELYEEDVMCKYLMMGFEKAPKTGTPHLQCFIYYTHPISKMQMIKRTHRDYDVKPSDAKNPVNGYAYCSDDFYYTEFGERPIQGQRTDLNMMYKDVWHDKKPLGEIMKLYPEKYGYFFRSIDRVREELLRFDSVVVTYDTEGDPVKIMGHLYQIFNHSFDRLFMSHEVTNMEFCSMLYSKKYRILFYPRSEDIHDTFIAQLYNGGHIIARITSDSVVIIDEEKCENLKLL